MATYASDTFIPAINPGENFIKLRDTTGTIRHKVYNDTTASLFINLDTLVIKMVADSKPINLKFATTDDAVKGLSALQVALVTVKQNFENVKNSKFSDFAFEIYNEAIPANFVSFDLSNLTTSKALTIGKGTVLQTDYESDYSAETPNQLRFFENFVTNHNLTQGTYTTAMIKSHSNETGHFGILEMTLSNPATDAYLWSNVNSIQLNNSAIFSSA